MEILVINYSDWIGYHLVDALLQEGYTVTGKDGANGNEILEDFFARNSYFKIYDKQKKETFSYAVCIGDELCADEFTAEKIILLNANQSTKVERATAIEADKLFGEWMPMDEEGFHYKGKKVLFSSDNFKTKGIYIGDFVKEIVKWLKEAGSGNDVPMRAVRSLEKETEKLENFFHVKENKPIEESIQQVIEHYRKFHALYPDIE